MSEVRLPGGTIVEFPDGASAEFISEVIRRHSAPGKVLHSIMNPQILQPFRQMAGEIASDILPVTSQQRSIGRIEESLNGIGERTPIGQVLSGADIALETGGMAADFVPGLKAAGIAGASLIPMMMKRSTKGLSPLAKVAKKQQGSIGVDDLQ